MRVIFMGTPDFSVGTLEEIIKAGHSRIKRWEEVRH